MRYTIALLLALAAPGAWSADKIHAGVNWSAVPWETLCPNVAPVQLVTKEGSCPRAHPADPFHEQDHLTFSGPGFPPVPPPVCASIEARFTKYTTPQSQAASGPWSKALGAVGGPWGHCAKAFRNSISARQLDRRKRTNKFVVSFADWRNEYFSAYMIEVKK